MADSSNGYVPSNVRSDLAESAAPTSADNSTPANGAVSMLDSSNTARGDMADGHAAVGNMAGRDAADGATADDLNWALQGLEQNRADDNRFGDH
jgi:hypothetical protein